MARRPTRTGIILAWDKSSPFEEQDADLFDSIASHIDLVKVGLEAMTVFDPETGESVALCVSDWARDQHSKGTMWDAKVHDIANTVDKSIRNMIGTSDRIKLLTVHAAMSDGALQKANVACAQANVTALAVTVLTDIDDIQCQVRFGEVPRDAVAKLALNAYKFDIKGLVCSPKELDALNVLPLDDMIRVVPGIRPEWATANDQKRVMTPGEAAKAGADYIVVGRPILEPPSGMTPAEAVKRIREELDEALAKA
jgi:orotidine-5'-phosphate decarboxylase